MNDDDTKIYKIFFEILDKRCVLKRKRRDTYFALFSSTLVGCIAVMKEQEFLTERLSEKMGYILEDCEIFHGMSEGKAMDAMRELSDYACLFVNNDRYSHLYTRICELIGLIRVSYPVDRNDWTESKQGY